eukprot:TRINITY_DN1626_c0_g1_i1.p1 TRINITY_DN1626_c0_g1~~TRINITY_DN1626_c0_g1_i1.p1  ORF type:complete len:231 (+),score=41.16 TRINITY_DN1626_c0_g1_i1:31-723(+)
MLPEGFNVANTVFYLAYLQVFFVYQTVLSVIFFVKRAMKGGNKERQVVTLDNSVFDEVQEGVLSIGGIPSDDNDIADLKKAGVQYVVSLVQPSEVVVNDYYSKLEKQGIEVIPMPVKDHFIPTNVTEYYHAVARTAELLKEGNHVRVHCRAGVGRSATFAFAVLQKLDCGLFKGAHRMRVQNPNVFRNVIHIAFGAFFAFTFCDITGIFYKDTLRHVLTNVRNSRVGEQY